MLFPADLNYQEKLKSPQKFVIGFRYKIIEEDEKLGITGATIVSDDMVEFRRKRNESVRKISKEFVPIEYKENELEFVSFDPETNELGIIPFVNGVRRRYVGYIIEIEENEILIRDGILIRGALDKKTIGVGARFLTYFFRTYNSKISVDFVSDIDYLTNWYFERRPFSIGIEDMADTEHFEANLAFITKDLEKTRIQLEAFGGPSESVQYEAIRQMNVKNALTSVVEEAGGRYLSNPRSGYYFSSVKQAIESGAKGKKSAIGQSMMYGLQTEGGQLIPQRMEGRVSSFFPKGVYIPEAIGFCPSPLVRGLTPFEMFYAASSARFDMANTKTSVSVSGYLQRQFATLIGGVVVDTLGESIYDIKGSGKIIQLLYGDCGIPPSKLYRFQDAQGSFLSAIDVHQIIQNL
jgi:DNA-directed RNA polymerase beta' subunit